jgi:hypothetical protein
MLARCAHFLSAGVIVADIFLLSATQPIVHIVRATLPRSPRIQQHPSPGFAMSAADDHGAAPAASAAPAAPADAANAPAAPSSTAAAAAFASLHPLASAWSLWHQPEAPKGAKVQPRKIDPFHSVEEFWSIYNALPGVDAMGLNEIFMFFREPVEPRYEDPNVIDGGQTSVLTDHADAADVLVRKLLMGMLGESLTVEHFGGKRNVIAGLRYSAKSSRTSKGKQFKVDVWMTDAAHKDLVESALKVACEAAGVRTPSVVSSKFKDSL